MIRAVFTAASDSSGHYRVQQPVKALQDEPGLDLHVAENGLPVEFAHGRYVTVHGLDDVDLLVLQRPMMWFMPDLIRDVQRRGIRVIVELDDDFHTAHPQNRAFALNHPKVNGAQNWHHLGECVRLADWLTVSTPALARRYGQHGRCTVVRNSVDDFWLTIQRPAPGKTIGWPGTIINHPTDVQATQGGVGRALAERPDWAFMNVGGAKYVDEIKRQLGLTDSTRILATDWRPLDLHPFLVAQMDVGIVPLADLTFNAAKSYLKGLEFAALGVPFVASALPEYRWLQSTYGIGTTVRNREKEWYRAVAALLDDGEQQFRRAAAAHAREIVRGSLTISRNAWRWAEVWHSVAVKGDHRARLAV